MPQCGGVNRPPLPGPPMMRQGVMPEPADRVICQQLVVEKHDGIKLSMVGKIGPEFQESAIDVFKAIDADSEPIMHIYVSEQGHDKGILLESSHGVAICFLDTSHAKAPPSGRAHVSISRAAPQAWDPQVAPFAMIQRSNKGIIEARRGTADGSEGTLMMTLREDPSGVCASIYDSQDHLVANTEGSSQAWSKPQTLLQIGYGVDSGLVICLVLAAAKLRVV